MKTQIKKNYVITFKNHTIIIFYLHWTCFILMLDLVMYYHARENNLILLRC